MGLLDRLIQAFGGAARKAGLSNVRELESLKNEIHRDYEEYKAAALKLGDKAEQLQSDYDALIMEMGLKRKGLRDKFTELYQTLSQLIGVGKEMTSHDDVAATPAFEPAPPLMPSMFGELGLDAPIGELRRRFTKIKQIEQLAAQYHDKKPEYGEDLWMRESREHAISAAIVIAKRYLEFIESIGGIIDDILLPELRMVHAFLYADAIKTAIMSGKPTTVVTPTPVSDFRVQDSPYHRHHVFVKNAVDYYMTACRLFIEPYIPRLISNNSAAKDISNEFDLYFKDVASNLESVKKSILLTKEAES